MATLGVGPDGLLLLVDGQKVAFPIYEISARTNWVRDPLGER